MPKEISEELRKKALLAYNERANSEDLDVTTNMIILNSIMKQHKPIKTLGGFARNEDAARAIVNIRLKVEELYLRCLVKEHVSFKYNHPSHNIVSSDKAFKAEFELIFGDDLSTADMFSLKTEIEDHLGACLMGIVLHGVSVSENEEI